MQKVNDNKKQGGPKLKLDKLDQRIIDLLLFGKDNKYISKKIKIPLSTVQRRTRRLFDENLLNSKTELNYEKLGYKRGFLHVYLSNGQVHAVGNILVNRSGILSVAVHIGNSDLVALFIYRNSKDLLDIISEIKHIEGVEKVLWSEEVFFIPMNERKINLLHL